MPLQKVPLQLSCRPLQVLEGCYKVSPAPSLLQAEQPQLSQPFLTGDMFHPSDHFCGPVTAKSSLLSNEHRPASQKHLEGPATTYDAQMLGAKYILKSLFFHAPKT